MITAGHGYTKRTLGQDLGDGLYAVLDGHRIELSAGGPTDPSDTVYLTAQTMLELARFADQWFPGYLRQLLWEMTSQEEAAE